MKFAVKTYWKQYQAALLLGLVAASAVLTLRSVGFLQLLELKVLDGLTVLRPKEAADDRVVVVGIGESDLNWLQSPVLSDQILADLIGKIERQKPRVIGLDFYRNLPVQPGTEALEERFRTTTNLIGIEKIITDERDGSQTNLPGNKILAEADQVAASDVVVDLDGRVRRALLFPATTGPRILEGLGLRLALDYLMEEELYPDPDADVLTLGEARFLPVNRFTGGYMKVNDGGYQLLFNPRHSEPTPLVSLQAVLSGEVPPDLMRDRIVLIGSTALSSADVFYSSHRNAKGRDTHVTFGIELHAELASQVLSAVLDGRPLFWSLSEWLEILLIIGFAYAGILSQRLNAQEWQRFTSVIGVSGGSILVSYGTLVTWGLWLPLVPLLLSLWTASALMVSQRIVQLRTLAERDGLTQLANRRTFDEALQRAWMKGLRSQHPLALIICDVDHFKLYNDAYGHQQGDDCLRNVAKAIRSAVKQRKDLAARYGGEEFVILLPNTTADAALALAEKVRQSIKSAHLPHKASKVTDHVTLSLGVTCLVPSMEVPMSSAVQLADLGLYRAKEAGRDRANLHLPETNHERLD